MKKLFAFVLLSVLGISVFAQVQTLHDPNITPTITQEQIEAMRNNNPNRSIIVLDFEGIGDYVPVGNYYNGGAGPNYGVDFSANTLALIDADAGGSGNFANEPSPSTIMFFLSGGTAFMNVAAGFSTGFSFYYTSVSAAGTVTVYDGLNGTGTLLASAPLPALGSAGNGDPTGTFDTWGIVGVPFVGVAKSVGFSGVADQIGFDDVTFGSTTPGVETPVSNWALFIGIGLILVIAIIRFRRIL